LKASINKSKPFCGTNRPAAAIVLDVREDIPPLSFGIEFVIFFTSTFPFRRSF